MKDDILVLSEVKRKIPTDYNKNRISSRMLIFLRPLSYMHNKLQLVSTCHFEFSCLSFSFGSEIFFNHLIFEQWVSDIMRGVRHGDFVSLYDGPCQEIMDWHWQIPKSWTWQLTDAVRSVSENSLRLRGQKQCEYSTLVWFWVFQTKCVESKRKQASSGRGKAGGEGTTRWNLYIEPNTSVIAEFFTDYR